MLFVADIHARFERIHPFRDGNGRVGRLATNLLLVRHGYPPVVIYKRDRTRYLNALRRADRGDPGPLAEIFARAVTDGIYRFLLPGLAGPHRLVRFGRSPTQSSLATRSPLQPSAADCVPFAGRISGTRRDSGSRTTRTAATGVREFRPTRAS
jgi:hypothetical protein